MKVLMLDPPQTMLDERRRLGLDGRDEMWDGVQHMVPPPGESHQGLSSELFLVLAPRAKQLGLEPRVETGLFRTAQDYRVPDQLYRRPEDGSERGAEGAELVVEIRSPGDETYEKVGYYAALGVTELLVVHPGDRRAEVYRAVGSQLLPVQAVAGVLGLDTLGIELRTVDGVLHLSWDGGTASV